MSEIDSWEMHFTHEIFYCRLPYKISKIKSKKSENYLNNALSKINKLSCQFIFPFLSRSPPKQVVSWAPLILNPTLNPTINNVV